MFLVITAGLVAIFGCGVGGSPANMNGEYLISNPHPSSPNKFSTDYTTYENVDYFDVYSPPINTRYGEVYWTMMGPVPLDQHIVDRFRGKVMAIVGYEADQVMTGSGGEDVSVPIIWAYNHHFEAYLSGAQGEVRLSSPSESGKHHHPGATEHWHSFRRSDIPDPNPSSDIPVAQWFSEGNGGEFRKSFHGYPHGMAQLIESPQTFQLEPMQIDTKNRFYNGTDFRAGALPRISPAPANASYSGLLECPCSTRIPRNISVAYATVLEAACPTSVDGANVCFDAPPKVGLDHVDKFLEVSSAQLPPGCSAVVSSSGSTTVYWNQLASSTTACGTSSDTLATSTVGTYHADAAAVVVTITLNASVPGGLATITLKGPATVWYGVGINSPHFDMADHPYTIVVDGTEGAVTEWKLGNHAPGVQLRNSLTVVANSVTNGQRTVVLQRSFAGITADHYTFDPTVASLPLLAASGTGPNFGYHGGKQRTGGTIYFAAIDAPTCICNAGVHGTINGIPFEKDCLPEPTGDLLEQKNPTCFVDTYQGGLWCCHHQVVLLDVDQVQPTDVLTYRLKFRFWFQEYTAEPTPSHQNLIRIYWQTECNAGEYDVTSCPPGTPPTSCVHTIRSNFTVRDMMPVPDCSVRQNPGCWGNTTGYQGMKLVYAAGHCHAPSCISMELYNADTNELLCRHDPLYGKSHEIFDELGYLAIPPCLYGPEEDGLMPPTFLSFDTKLYSVKKNNNTVAHFGEMASWQMRGILVKA